MSVFLDTSVLLAGLIDLGPQSGPAQALMHNVAEKKVAALTAWHCCLEFYSVGTRLPAEYRLSPADAVRLLEEEVFARMTVHVCQRSTGFPCCGPRRVTGLAADAFTTRTSQKLRAPRMPPSS